MEVQKISIPSRPKRHFLPETLTIDSWERVEPFFRDLESRPLISAADLRKWLADWSELEAVLSEDFAWRYVRMSCDTLNPRLVDAHNFFISEIDPKAAPYSDKLNRKLMGSPCVKELTWQYSVFLKRVKNSLDIFREKNIPLFVEIEVEKQKYAQITSEMTIDFRGSEITLQKAASYLKETDRAVREEVFRKAMQRRAKDEGPLNALFGKLVKLQDEVAGNAGFGNFRDYKFVQLCRFDYTPADCFSFHESIRQEVCPVVDEIDRQRKEMLGLDVLRPWDTEADMHQPLKPFHTGEELIQRSTACFSRVHPFFGQCIETMRAMGHLDLESRKGKAPGGFNYPLYETGIPFVFMNSVGSLRDLVTMMHEGGHAVHSILTKELELTDFKNLPSEVAELASMSMELISMEHWEVFFPDRQELLRARREQMEKVLKGLTGIARTDRFQHWIYENPRHSIEERNAKWKNISEEFGSKAVDWTGFEKDLERSWQSILHLYEVPFYYIEYGFAQLGALAVWRNYKADPVRALGQFQDALRLGYTRSIPDIYRTAGIEFNFSRGYVKELVAFVKEELSKYK